MAFGISHANSGGQDALQNLMVVLRETAGANKQDEEPKSLGRMRMNLPDGSETELQPAWFDFIGDMHLRFVFDGPRSMRSASSDDLVRLGLTPTKALNVAIDNIKRMYGDPTAKPWSLGLMQVSGKSPDLNSSYFLDRQFWRGLLRDHPEGLVAAVPKRGALLFAPLSDAKAVAVLRNSIGYLHSSSEQLRISGALYLFKDDQWTVFRPAMRR